MTRLPWCGPLEDPDAATATLLARIAGTTTHAESAALLGLSARTWARWWAALRAEVPSSMLPPRTHGGTTASAALGRERARRRRRGEGNCSEIPKGSGNL